MDAVLTYLMPALIVWICLREASVMRRLYLASELKSLAWFQAAFAMFALAATVTIDAQIVIWGPRDDALYVAATVWVPLGIGALMLGIAMVTIAMWHAMYREYDDFMILLRGYDRANEPNVVRSIHVLFGGQIPNDLYLTHERSTMPTRAVGIGVGVVPILAALVASQVGPATHALLHHTPSGPLACLHPLAWACLLVMAGWGVTLIVGALINARPRDEVWDWDEILNEILA